MKLTLLDMSEIRCSINLNLLYDWELLVAMVEGGLVEVMGGENGRAVKGVLFSLMYVFSFTVCCYWFSLNFFRSCVSPHSFTVLKLLL